MWRKRRRISSWGLTSRYLHRVTQGREEEEEEEDEEEEADNTDYNYASVRGNVAMIQTNVSTKPTYT